MRWRRKGYHSSTLAWRIPWPLCGVHGVAKGRTWLSNFIYNVTLFLLPNSYWQVNNWHYPWILLNSTFYSKISIINETCEPADQREIWRIFFFSANCQPSLTFRTPSKVICGNANVQNSSWIACFCISHYPWPSKIQPSELMPSGKSLNDIFKKFMSNHSHLEFSNLWSTWLCNVYYFFQPPICVWQLNWALLQF